MNENKTFVFSLSWYEVLLEYPEDVRLEVYEAIMCYASSAPLPELKPLARMAFSFIRREMDYNRERYQATIDKRREAGRKGADTTNAAKARHSSANFGTARHSSVKAANADFAEQETANLGIPRHSSAKAAVNVNVNDNVFLDVEEERGVQPAAEPCQAEQLSEEIPMKEIMEHWNTSMSGHAIPAITAITPGTKRASAVRARFREHGHAAVMQVITNAAASSFLNGNNQRSFIATFDWIFQPLNFLKVLEGNYKNTSAHETNKTDISERRGTEPSATSRKDFQETF